MTPHEDMAGSTPDALSERETMLRTAERVGGVGSWTRNLESGELRCSDQLYTILGRSPADGELTLDDFVLCVHPQDRRSVAEGILLPPEEGAANASHYRIVRPDGAVRHLSSRVEITRDAVSGVPYEVGMLSDVTETHDAEARMRAYQQRLREMAARVDGDSTQVRRELATQLHDEVSTPLAAVLMRLQLMRGDRVAEPDAEELDAVIDLLRQTVSKSRELASEMAPPILYELGIVAAIEWLCDRYGQQTGLRCEVSCEGEPVANHEDADLLFRAARELLSNVCRHAGTSTAIVRLTQSGEALSLTVADAGAGFDPGRPPHDGAFGLMAIREAMELRGGSFELDSVPSGGTTVTLTLPTSSAPDALDPAE